MQVVEIAALVVLAVLMLVICGTVTGWPRREGASLQTRPLQIRDLGVVGQSLSPEELAGVQQAASGADLAPLQSLAQEVEARKAEAAAEAEAEVLEPEPALADPEAELRRRVTRERLQSMARSNPGAIAGVVQTWISERR